MTEIDARPKILFLCTANSCRSQMAEGWARALWADRFDVYSAGIESRGLDLRAVQVMGEAGVAMEGQRSKTLTALGAIEFDLVVTVCADADRRCPAFPGAVKKVHVGFDDPPRLAADARSDEEALAHYRRVRDEIRRFSETLPALIEAPEEYRRPPGSGGGSDS
jgi:arsenate reductase